MISECIPTINIFSSKNTVKMEYVVLTVSCIKSLASQRKATLCNLVEFVTLYGRIVYVKHSVPNTCLSLRVKLFT